MNYFNKELSELTIEEAAYLAALPKAPNNYHPFRQTKAAIARRNWIIDQMAENGYITAAEAEAAKTKPLGVNIRPTRRADLRRRLLRRGSAAHAAFGEDGLRRGDKLYQRRPFRAHHARSRTCSAWRAAR